LIHRYSVDEKTKKLFDTNLPNERDINRTVREFEWLPEYVVKKGNGRVLGTLLIKQCAQDNQCDTIGALQK
jgi:hypothetical protein